MKKIAALTIVLLLMIATNFISASQPAAAAAVDCNNPGSLTAQQSLQCGSCGAAGSAQCASNSIQKNSEIANRTLSQTISSILNYLSAATAVIAVIMIVAGGIRYVTSAGKQESVAAARSTIVYALVGLGIAAVAQIVVHFVINTFTT